MMLKRFKIEHLKALLTTFGKSTTGNHQELLAVANQLIKEKENNPGFRNFFMTLHARIMYVLNSYVSFLYLTNHYN